MYCITIADLVPVAAAHAFIRTEKEGRPLRARPAVNKGRTADSTQLSIFDYSISRDTPLPRPALIRHRTLHRRPLWALAGNVGLASFPVNSPAPAKVQFFLIFILQRSRYICTSNVVPRPRFPQNGAVQC